MKEELRADETLLVLFLERAGMIKFFEGIINELGPPLDNVVLEVLVSSSKERRRLLRKLELELLNFFVEERSFR